MKTKRDKDIRMVKCCLCGNYTLLKDSNNALPLKEGRCCKACNPKVIKYRTKLYLFGKT